MNDHETNPKHGVNIMIETIQQLIPVALIVAPTLVAIIHVVGTDS